MPTELNPVDALTGGIAVSALSDTGKWWSFKNDEHTSSDAFKISYLVVFSLCILLF